MNQGRLEKVHSVSALEYRKVAVIHSDVERKAREARGSGEPDAVHFKVESERRLRKRESSVTTRPEANRKAQRNHDGQLIVRSGKSVTKTSKVLGSGVTLSRWNTHNS